MASWRSHEIGKKKRTYRIKEQIRFAKKLTIEHLFYTISIATNKRTFFKRLWISGHPSSGCDGIHNEFIKAMGYSCQWILSAFGTNGHHHEEVSCIMTSKNRSSMVKETKAKGYKIVFLVWYILLCALCNHTVSNSYRLIRLSGLLFKWKWSFAQNSKWICWTNCSKCIPLITFFIRRSSCFASIHVQAFVAILNNLNEERAVKADRPLVVIEQPCKESCCQKTFRLTWLHSSRAMLWKYH